MKYRISPGIVSTVVDGEITVLDPRTGLYFGLEHAAARVWELLQSGAPDLVEQLQGEFDVDRTTCEAHVGELIADLEARGLVQPA